MIGSMSRVLKAGAVALALVIAGLFATSATQAASINYGNSPLIPPGVSFLSVTESSVGDTVPLYGAPSYFITGMSFTPTPAFAASAAGGAADLTDGQLNFTVATTGGLGVTDVNLTEGGVYSLTGLGTAATQAQAGANLKVTVTEINGVGIAPIVLPSSAASVSFNLAANPGAGQLWAVGVSVDVAAALGVNQRATRVDVVIDNALVAISQAGSNASIAKTSFGIDIDVPEPTTAAMAMLALCGLGLGRSRQR